MQKSIKSLILGMLALLLNACRYSANADRFLEQPPTLPSIAGTYYLREQTVYLQRPEHDFKSSTITLNDNLTCQFVDYPLWDERNGTQQAIPKFYSGPGTFRITQTGFTAGLFKDTPNYGVQIVIPNAPLMVFTFALFDDSIELVNEFGDPDQWVYTCWSQAQHKPNKPL